MRRVVEALIMLMLSATPATAQTVGPAPAGEEAVVAQKVIWDNFDKADCPLVVDARRFGDGSIKAVCNNGEQFRIFSVSNQDVAMKCSAAEQLGISGC